MKRMDIWMLGIVFAVFVVLGIYERGHHKNILEHYMQTGDCGTFITGVFDLEREPLLEYERDYYSSTDIVVKAQLSGMPEACFGATKVPLKILEVYRGENLEKGDEIRYISNISYSRSRKSKELMGSLVNFMREGTPYLVFLNKPGIDYHTDNIYLAPEFSNYPYFAMEEIENVYDREEWEQLGRVNYLRTMQKNEFFVNSKEALELLLDFKKEILETYVTE